MVESGRAHGQAMAGPIAEDMESIRSIPSSSSEEFKRPKLRSLRIHRIHSTGARRALTPQNSTDYERSPEQIS